MGRRAGAGVWGPYRRGRTWRLVIRSAGGKETSASYPSRQQAERIKAAFLAEWEAGGRTVTTALESYAAYLTDEKRNKPRSTRETVRRLKLFLVDDLDAPLGALSPGHCQARYRGLCRGMAVDSHRNILAEVKTFFRYCVHRRWMSSSPVESIVGQGRRRKGKPQLRLDEARHWYRVALKYAPENPGAVAALCTVLLGMRAGEIVSRRVRDLDDNGRLLWIPESKTAAGRRTLRVPDVLQPLLSGLAAGKRGDALLFGQHWRDWPREWVQRLCRIAGVPSVTAHGMRGLHSTAAQQVGVTSAVVAAALGHEDPRTTTEAYTDQAEVASAQRDRLLSQLSDPEPKGGEK